MPNLSWTEVRNRSVSFSRRWATESREQAEKQSFWNDFFLVFGRERRSVASFEVAVKNIRGDYNYIDLLWRGVLLVEHKTRGKSLAAAHSQAFAYIEDLARDNRFDEIPRFVIVSDFARFALYDLEPEADPGLPLFAGRQYTSTEFNLADFHSYLRHFAFIKGERALRLKPEDPANQKAYDLMCQVHDEIAALGFKGTALERFLVRILFCLFAEDTGVFELAAFETFVRENTRDDGSDLGSRLNQLFAVLNTPKDQWSEPDRETFAGFRYVNGDLFKDPLPFPSFTRSTRNALLSAAEFQWARVSPAVFGSLFQGIMDMDKSARRQQGAHYTSERDILKVVSGLFLDSLQAEFTALKSDASTRRRSQLDKFHKKIRELRFLDPACGCGNFLIIAYREVRQLELEVLKVLHADGEQAEALSLLVRVDVNQFYGIELHEWPARIAEVAMWLMDHQMNQEVSEFFARDFARLPLTTSPHIVIGNALRCEWETVLPREKCSYILGNPPFIGKQFRNPEQQADMDLVWSGVSGSGVLDYVTCWYRKAAGYIANSQIPVAFVSTNSITQGEQVGILWGELFGRWKLKILFAHRTFPWASEARGSAHVHVVIIGFGTDRPGKRRLFDYDPRDGHSTWDEVEKISPYLIANSEAVVQKHNTSLSKERDIVFGSMPNDGGHLLLSGKDKEALLAVEPGARPYIRKLLGSEEFINGIDRWCLWLADARAEDIRKLPAVMNRIEGVRRHRESSPRAATQALANQPMCFGENRQPTTTYLLIPGVSSENRRYVPMAMISPEVIASNLVYCMEGATVYHFGVLTSAMHMAWMRTVCGRLKSDFRYSNKLVYNNFPWPTEVEGKRRAAVEKAAQAVLDSRKPFLPPQGASTLADLYDLLTMPPTLVQAHAALDRAVDRCYRDPPFKSDRERVEHLFTRYEGLTRKSKKALPSGVKNSLTNPSDAPDIQAEDTVAATLVPEWYRAAILAMEQGFIDDGTDRIMEGLEALLVTKKFDVCDADLSAIAAAGEYNPISALITLLTFTRSAAAHLPSRVVLREATRLRLIALKKNADAVLKHL